MAMIDADIHVGRWYRIAGGPYPSFTGRVVRKFVVIAEPCGPRIVYSVAPDGADYRPVPVDIDHFREEIPRSG